MTKMLATMIAGSLLNPESASDGLKTPVTAKARTMSMATISLRIRSVTSSPKAKTRITIKLSWFALRFSIILFASMMKLLVLVSGVWLTSARSVVKIFSVKNRYKIKFFI